MVAFIKSILSLLAIAAFTNAAPTTDADSAAVEKRDVSCRDDIEGGRASLSGAVECINYLASLGDTPCRGGIGGTAFCNRPGVQITGISDTWQGAESPCNNVARAAGAILDRCSRPGDNTVKGQNHAWGNGHLLVDIRNI
ncbi:hypothetical protein DL764_001343 [Monosporascus ibericus]|uniref:Cyanovirin-N domain-containing protein n=1 Tax=Monosporascus ibericus TaxID=155417 RepID=A0A4Q4TPR8_9PEZI|nr:hypothetical protein DL764_001343 [Monosporascus ibericus]